MILPTRLTTPISTPKLRIEIMEQLPRCRSLQSGEAGFWVPEQSGMYTYHLRSCQLRRFTTADARECLRNKHVLIIGDSVSRYQYMSLASFLHSGFPEASGNHEKGANNVCMPGNVWGSWKRFYLRSSAHFEGRELCDCFRPEGPWNPDFEKRTEENRFLSLPEHNLSLSYLQVFGGFPMHGHFPGRCRGSTQVPMCSRLNVSRAEVSRATHVLTNEEYDSNPLLDQGNVFDWQSSVHATVRDLVPNMEVDVLIYNTGLWGELKNATMVGDVMSAGSEVVKAGGSCFWKRTTKRFKCQGGDRRCFRDRWAPEEVADAVPVDQAKDKGWGIMDIATPTSLLEQDSFADGIHPRPFVYNELNNLLLNQVCLQSKPTRGPA
mmetsp:Transcript_25247/g.39624  ORF Transcript_25247/g.39624 Transcript_25247/m.39624 type:complete len:378 (+) Transcript_25247:1704-2837(+)